MAKFKRVVLARVQTQENFFTRVFDLSTLLVGRTTDTHIAVSDSSVSRHHLEVKIKGDQLWLTDLGSANGTFINGHKIEPHKKLQYQPGDIIRVGNQNTEISLEAVEKSFQEKDLESDLLPEDHRESLTQLINSAHAEAQRLQSLVKAQEEQMVRQSEQKAQTIIDNANAKVLEMLNEAEAMVRTTLEEGEKKRQALVQKSEKEAKEASAHVYAQAETLLQEAEKKSQVILTQAQNEVRDLKKRSENEADELVKKARQQTFDLKSQWEEEKRFLIKNAKVDLEIERQNVISDAKSTVQIWLDDAKKESDQIVADSRGVFDIAKADAEKKATIYYKEAEEKLASARLELENAKTESTRLLSQSKMTAEAMKIEADYLLEKAKKEAEAIESNAQSISQQLQMEAHLQKAQAKKEAEALSQKIISEANVQAQQEVRNLLNSAEHDVEIKRQKLLGHIELIKLDTEKLNYEAKVHFEETTQLISENRRKAEKDSENLISEAKNAAQLITQEADDHRQNLLRKTEAFMESKIKATQHECEKMIQEAKAEVERIQKENRSHLEKTQELQKNLQQLQEQKHKIQGEIQSGDQKFIELTKTNELKLRENSELEKNLEALKQQHSRLNQDLQQARAQLAKEHDTRKQILIELDTAKRNLETSKDNHQIEIQKLKDSVKKEIEEYKNRERQSLDESKKTELQVIRQMREQANAQLKASREEISLAIINLVEGKTLPFVNELMKNTNSEQRLDWHELFQKELRPLVSQELFKVTFNEALKSETTYQPPSQVQKMSRKMKMGAIASFVLLIGFLLYPPTRSSLLTLLSAGSQAALDQFLQTMKQERSKRYHTQKTPEWKSNYTDAILYSQGFSDSKLSSETQKEWINQLQDHMLVDHKIDEDATIKLISLEAALVAQLQEQADQIHPDSVDGSIRKMRELEDKAVAEMKVLLKDEKNFEDFQNFSKEFYHQYLSRRPASQKLPE